MKANKDFIFKKTKENSGVIVPVGERSLSFNGMVTLNETGCFLWELLSSGDLTRDELVSRLLDEYDTDAQTAARDVDAFLAKLDEAGLIERP